MALEDRIKQEIVSRLLAEDKYLSRCCAEEYAEDYMEELVNCLADLADPLRRTNHEEG